LNLAQGLGDIVAEAREELRPLGIDGIGIR
jgi:hypothetical protein